MKTRTMFLLWLTVAAPLGAQAPKVAIESGQAVRITTLKERLSGKLLATYQPNDAALHLCDATFRPCGAGGDSTGAHRVASAELLRVEIQRGNRAKTGAIAGGITGFLVGGFYGLMVAGLCDAADCPSLGQGVAVGGLIGGAALAIPGALLGSLFPKWGPAP